MAVSEALTAGSGRVEVKSTLRHRSSRVLRVDRGSAAIASSAVLRGVVEQAVVDAANKWMATAPNWTGDRDAYSLLSILGVAVLDALNDETVDLSAWPVGTPIREPLDRLRRALLERETGDSDMAVRSADLLACARAIERVHDVCQRDTSHRFTQQLATCNARDVVVGVAHDMRSPLSSILFLVESLRNGRRATMTPAEERQLGLVYGAALGLSQLVSDVIELARGCDRLLDRRPIPFSLSELLNGVLRVVQPIAEEKRLSLYTELVEVDARIGYPAALTRVMLNLITNALKFTNEGYVEVTLRQLSRTQVQFSVRDTGPGISPDELHTLYDALRHSECSKGYLLSSSGLGLSICQKLITAMGGALQVETIVGKQTRFHFVLDLPPAAKI